MDKMIDHLGELVAPKKLGPREVDKIGAYLVGRGSLAEAEAALPSASAIQHYFMYNRQVDYIAHECQKEPSLMPRLGRYLTLIEKLHRGMYLHICDRFLDTFTMEELFLTTGLGFNASLDYMANSGQFIFDEATLAKLYDQHHEELEEFLLQNDAVTTLCLLTYWCAKKGVDPLAQGTKGGGLLGALLGKGKNKDQQLAQKLLGAILYAFTSVAIGWGERAYREFVRQVEAHCPTVTPAVTSKETVGKIKGEKHYHRSQVLSDLFRSLRFSGGRLQTLNQLTAALSKANPESFCWQMMTFDQDAQGDQASASQMLSHFNIGQMMNVYRNYQAPDEGLKEELNTRVERMLDLTDAMGVSRAYVVVFILYQDAYYPLFWHELKERYCSESLVWEGLHFGTRIEKLCLIRRLEELGQPQDLDTMETVFTQVFGQCAQKCEATERQQMQDWLLGKSTAQLSDLPELSVLYGNQNYHQIVVHNHGDLVVAALLLRGKSKVPERLFAYLCHHNNHQQARIFISGLRFGQGLSLADVISFFMAETEGAAVFRFLASMAARGGGKDSFAAPARELLQEALKNHADAAATAIISKETEADTKVTLLSELYEFRPDYRADFLLECLGDKSKKVRQVAIGMLMGKKELQEQVEALLEAKKKDVREAAQELMLAYTGTASDHEEVPDVLAFCTKNMPKNAAVSLRWALPEGAPPVRYAQSEEMANPTIVQCYLSLVLGAKSMELPPAVAKVKAVLHEEDLRQVARIVFDQWLGEGAPAKNKTALLLYGLHGDDRDVAILTKQIEQWAQNSRGAIAAEAVKAMVLANRDMALLTVDNFSRKFKNKQVKKAAQEAFGAAAEKLGTTAEALGDRIIPTLGFDQRGELVIDYGTRSFTAMLSPELTITIQDQNGKTLKSLPKPGVNDDAVQAEKAKAAFTTLKKSLKAVVATQSDRLTQALATGRLWEKEAWTKLFVENPIMHSFAIGLVWGVYEADSLVNTFRYLEDGTFTDHQEEEIALTEIKNGKIGLIHPLDLNEEQLASWQQQLADYEIKQPIPQLARTVYLMTDAEKAAVVLARFGGRKLLGITLLGRMQKNGWLKGSVQDAGVFYTFYKEIGDIGVQLYFSGMYVSPYMDEEITVGEAVFYQAGSVQRGSYVYDDVDQNRVTPLKDIQPRLFSEIVLDLAAATATGEEIDESWQANRSLRAFQG